MNNHESRRHGESGSSPQESPVSAGSDTALRRIGDSLHGLRYGSVLAIVQDGVVVQIERTEKTRFGK